MKILLAISILFWSLSLVNYRSEIKYECEKTIIDEINEWSLDVKGLTIPPEEFAKYCIIVFWCESRLNPKIVNDKQQSFFQMTGKTRKALDIPDLMDCSVREILDYYYVYLKSTKKLHKVKSSIDLHVLNAAPSRFYNFHLLRVTPTLKYLDYDEDNLITRKDIKRFQTICAQESKFIKLLTQ